MGDLYTALGFSRGALPDAPLSPYAKLLLMLAGIESPGTIQVSGLCAGACWALLLGAVGQLTGLRWPLVQRCVQPSALARSHCCCHAGGAARLGVGRLCRASLADAITAAAQQAVTCLPHASP